MNLILTHGLGQSASAWDKTAKALPDGVSAFCPELSELSRSGGYGELYSAFRKYCGSFDGELNLCGLSLGAMLALNYAADFPDRVRSLVLIAAQYKAPKALMRLQGLIFRVMPKKSFEGTGFGKEDFIRLNSSMAELDFSKRLDVLPIDTLVVVGKRDKPNAEAAGILSMLLGCPLEVIGDSGHEVNIDAPERLAEVITSFYDRSGLL